jgi:hypothetical protein
MSTATRTDTGTISSKYATHGPHDAETAIGTAIDIATPRHWTWQAREQFISPRNIPPDLRDFMSPLDVRVMSFVWRPTWQQSSCTSKCMKHYQTLANLGTLFTWPVFLHVLGYSPMAMYVVAAGFGECWFTRYWLDVGFDTFVVGSHQVVDTLKNHWANY